MMTDKIVQFITFETTLKSGDFVKEWEQYARSASGDKEVILQQSEKNGVFRYIAQHHCVPDEFKFIFTKAGKSFRNPGSEIKARQAGGYSILQRERRNDTHAHESKIFAFLLSANANLEIYKQLSANGKLNIYEAYFENCQYAYILEYFIKSKNVAEILLQLKEFGAAEIRTYTDCLLQAVEK